jgi:hypothetical protein
MNPLDYIPKSIFGIIIIALLTTNFSCAWKNNRLELEVNRAATKIAELKKEHSEAVLTAQIAYNNVADAYRKKESALQTVADNRRKEDAKKLATATAYADDLRVRLSATSIGAANATDSNAPTSVSAGQAAGGGDVPKLPASFGFVDEALRAEAIRGALLGCYKQYDDARDTLNTPP